MRGRGGRGGRGGEGGGREGGGREGGGKEWIKMCSPSLSLRVPLHVPLAGGGL